eukprot:3180841-Amphidinium_carterae.1
MNAAYMTGIRTCAGKISHSGTTHHDTDEAILSRFHLPTLDELLDRRRLTYFLRLVTVDCELVRACASAYFGPHSFWPDMFKALNRIRVSTSCLLELPPASADTVDTWAIYVIRHHEDWKTLVKKYRFRPIDGVAPGNQDEAAHNIDDASQLNAPAEVDSDDVPLAVLFDLPRAPPEGAEMPVAHACHLCEFIGKNHAGLVMHLRRKHNVQSDLSLRTATPECPSCNTNYGTRARVLDHYRTCLRCRNYVLDHVPPMSEEEFAEMMQRERYVDQTHTRASLPKPGRKPPGIRPPTTEYKPVYLDPLQEATVQAAASTQGS